MNNIKFKTKIYSVVFFLIVAFSISVYSTQSITANITNNIEKLKNENENLQFIILLLSDIEKLKKSIYEYTIDANDTTKDEIIKLFDTISQNGHKINSDNEKINFFYSKLIENIKKYNENFKIAQKHIPINTNLRNKLKEDVEKIEDSMDNIDLKKLGYKDILDIVLIRKALLEVEKGVVRYFETDDREYTQYSKYRLEEIYNMLEHIKKDKSKDFNQKISMVKEKIDSFNTTFYKTIEHYRTYSMLTKVVMPGDAYEINYYAQNLKNFTLQRVDVINNQIDNYTLKNKKVIQITSVFYILLIIASFIIVLKTAIEPLRELTQMFERLSSGDDNVQIPSYAHNDDIGKLINSASKFQEKNKQTKHLLKETQDYKDNLEKKVEDEINKRRDREKALIQQSKLASMGEMIGAIAHQWRQPLNELTIRIQKLKFYYENDRITKEYVEGFVDKNKKTIEFMSKTIDDFRNFFRIDKDKREFHIKQAIEEILSMQSAQLKNHHISVELSGEECVYNGYKTEFQQVVMNIISNAKDIFVSKNIQTPIIKISIKDKIIDIQDNGGGIDESIIDRVFEPYFTTKAQGEGTGMGLYMSKMIIEDNMNGKIRAKNGESGAIFEIDFNKIN